MKWLLFILADLGIALALVIVFQVARLRRHIKKQRWYTVTPGYPDSLPSELLIMIAPYPLPRSVGYAAVTHVFFKTDESIVLKGRPPKAHSWSVSFYPPRRAVVFASRPAALDSTDIGFDADGGYRIAISAARREGNWLDTKGAHRGFIVIRCYRPEAGTRVVLPGVYTGEEELIAEGYASV
jgi:hypothetical protein